MGKEAVVVTWLDAQRLELGCHFDDKELEKLEPIACEIIGFKVYEDNTKIILAQEYWEDISQLKYINVIPKRSIIKTQSLEEFQKLQEDRHHNRCACGNVKFKTSKRCKECAAKNKYGKLSYRKEE
jgi:hypothetical protein